MGQSASTDHPNGTPLRAPLGAPTGAPLGTSNEPLTEAEKSSIRAIVFDTETTDLKGVAVQIAFGCYDRFGNLVRNFNFYFKLPPGYRIEPGAKAIHKIEESYLDQHGLDTEWVLLVLTEFAQVCGQVLAQGGRIVAHNASFDCGVIFRTWDAHANHLIQTVQSASVSARTRSMLAITTPPPNPFVGFSDKTFCTMISSKHYVLAKNKLGRIKNPRNVELYSYLYDGQIPEGELHDASTDIRVTAMSYFKGIQVGWW